MAKLTFAGSAAAAAFCMITATAAQDVASFNKPIERFSIGDLFPKMTGGLPETSAAWKKTADSARSLASTRSRDLKTAIEPVKAQIEKAKEDAKNAEKAKDFAAAGAAQGQVKTGEVVLDLLERLDDISSRQEDTAVAWANAADLMRKFVEADNGLDRYRSAGIAKPGQGQKDTRLDQAGFAAFKGHADALRDLGKSLSQLGDKLENLGSDHLKLAEDLERGGHIKASK